MNNTKELPILFSTPMVQAILAGRKTQTRRTFKYPGMPSQGPHTVSEDGGGNWVAWFGRKTPDFDYHKFAKEAYPDGQGIKCRYGKPGDVIWVRESFAKIITPDGNTAHVYRADDDYYKEAIEDWSGWKPSIHMPKEAARIWLKVKSIQVERLQDISENDAKAEGIREVTKDGKVLKYCVYDNGDTSLTPWSDMPRTAKEAFANLWQSINGPESWQANSWVWVVEFEVLSTTGKPDNI